jgi:hypothetical protein
MTDNTLSPAAQAVLRADAGARCVSEWDSVNDPPCHPSDSNWNGCFDCVNRFAVAAALRAAADQVMPEEPRPTGMRPCGDTYSAREIRRAERMKLREQLLAIAAELAK